MASLRVAIRADAATWIGTGHVMRCATLAEKLRAEGAEVQFVCRPLPGDCCGWLEGRGFAVHRLAAARAPFSAAQPDTPAHASWLGVPVEQERQDSVATLTQHGPFDWLVVDHYALDAKWERQVRHLTRRLMVIDDLADRNHDCQLLLDQNLQVSNYRYTQKVPASCRLLLGPDYALLRPEFAEMRPRLRSRDGTVRRILLFFGGADQDNLTSVAIETIASLDLQNIAVDVVVGASNSRRQEVELLCARMTNVTVFHNVETMAILLASADLMLGAAGSTTWERACLGLPALVVTAAENQREIAAAAQRQGMLTWLGDAAAVTREDIASALRQALSTPARLRAEGERGMALVDGRGTALVVGAMQT